MTKGGLIIRLIDVVLILLLGFINISDFTIKTQINLPQGSRESTQVLKKQTIHVRIDKDQKFEIDDGTNKISNISQIVQVEKKILTLREFYRKNNSEILVIIDPHLNTIIQLTVDLLDICEKYNIPKSIHYEL